MYCSFQRSLSISGTTCRGLRAQKDCDADCDSTFIFEQHHLRLTLRPPVRMKSLNPAATCTSTSVACAAVNSSSHAMSIRCLRGRFRYQYAPAPPGRSDARRPRMVTLVLRLVQIARAGHAAVVGKHHMFVCLKHNQTVFLFECSFFSLNHTNNGVNQYEPQAIQYKPSVGASGLCLYSSINSSITTILIFKNIPTA